MALICRICATLKKIENFVHLMDKELDLCNKLDKCCRILIPENDSLPQNVCQECVSGLNECWQFSENARDAQETLQKLFCPESESQSNNDKTLRKKLSQNQRQTKQSVSPTEEVKNEAPKTKPAQTFKHDIEHFTPDLDLEEVEDVSAGFPEERLEDDGAAGDDDQNDDVLSSEDESQTQMLISAEIVDDAAEVGEIEDEEDFEEKQVQETKDRISKVQQNPSQDSGEPQTWSTYPWECRDCSIRLPSSTHLREHALTDHSEGNDMKYYCVDCTKTFSKYYTFINHVKTRHRQALMNCCDICSTFCDDVESLVVHRATHDDQDHLHLCVTCGKGFKNAIGLQMHMNCHQPDSVKYKWECEDCGKKFGTRPNLRAHQKIHLGLKEFVCDQCGKSFVQKANLEEHLLTHVNDKPIECPECGKTNISECVEGDNTTNIISPLLPFQKLVDSSESIKKDVKFLKTQWTKTNFCLQKIYGVLCAINKSQSITQTFSPVIYQNPPKEVEKDLLKEEFPLTTDEEVNSCEKKINQNEEYKADLIDVLTKIFGTKGDENGNKLSFKVVDRMFTKQVLTNYSWTGISKDKNSPKKPFNCFHGLIDVIFRVVRLADNRWTLQNTENCLRDHILKQAKKRHSRHEFKTPARLAKHKSVHSDIKPYSCEECGRAFRERDTLKVHQRIHTGVMPFECEYCGKKFRFRSILSTHRHQHTGVRPYSCKDCNHHFTNWPNYNKHMKRVHNINTSRKSKPIEKDAHQSQSQSDRPFAVKIPRIDKQIEQFNPKRVVGTSKRSPRKSFHPIGNDAVVYTCDFPHINDFNGENHEISIEMEIQDE